jgi:hypothetical protein
MIRPGSYGWDALLALNPTEILECKSTRDIRSFFEKDEVLFEFLSQRVRDNEDKTGLRESDDFKWDEYLPQDLVTVRNLVYVRDSIFLVWLKRLEKEIMRQFERQAARLGLLHKKRIPHLPARDPEYKTIKGAVNDLHKDHPQISIEDCFHEVARSHDKTFDAVKRLYYYKPKK